MKVQQLAIKYFSARLRLLAFYSKKKAGNEAFRIFCTPFFRMAYDDRQMKHADRVSFRFHKLNAWGHQWNKGGNKKLLIAHGFRSASVNFQHFATRLAAKGYEVTAFDAPAHGQSEGNMLNAVEYKDFIQAINEQFGPFNAYLGHSFGGLAISLNLAEIEENSDLKIAFIAPAANARQLTESFFKEMKVNDAEIKAHFYANIERLSGHTIDWFSINRCAPFISSSVLWIHDKNDKVTPVEDALLAKKQGLPNFRFLFTENLGHRRIYRDEKVVETVINFL